MSQIYLIIVNNDNKGFLYNLFNRWSNVSQGLHGMFLVIPYITESIYRSTKIYIYFYNAIIIIRSNSS